ncbi:MAG: Tripartite ATP-independent periplasmic transporter [Syntrophorhabdaceae bacterium PtaU1.Bin034]|jgi:TRAP-type C4-dicarboxylate transport system permease small subunit|nr:MAG: Tripartite ATP-independent periplasmic transporter [Syntrophorhabdaceae bacterium PtaU1.Bin034]
MGDDSASADSAGTNLVRCLIYWPSKALEVIAAISLLFIMILTTCDVVGRAFARPVIGTYEIVSFGAGVLVGFSLPITTLEKGHVYVDFLLRRFSLSAQRVLQSVTSLMGIALFLGAGYNLLKMAADLQRAGEVSSTLQLPYYAIAYGIGFSCLVVCLVLVGEVVTIATGRHS